MERRLKLAIAYDGSAFAGWQSQVHKNTIQDRLESAFRQVSHRSASVQGAGRTDAGVHALAQCAHVDVIDRGWPPERWRTAINALLPPSIRITRASYTPSGFHARFSAKGKVYQYTLWNAEILPPFEYRRAWHIIRPLDRAMLLAAAAKFEGTHDFRLFAANRGKPVETTIRTIRLVRITFRGPRIAIRFDGDGFLYKMVRLMAGAIVHCAQGKSSLEEITGRLALRGSVSRAAAPADGLLLLRVRY